MNANAPAPRDPWTTGKAYERYIGRWSRPVAAEFLKWLAPPPSLRWLDVGCGSGALTDAILDRTDPRSVHGVDLSAGFIAALLQRVRDPRASFEVADAIALPLEDATFDAAVSGLVINFVPDPPRALAEMRRVVARGGRVALYVWDYAAGMQLIRHFWDAAVALDPAAAELDEARRFPLCAPDRLRALFAAAALRNLEVRRIEVATRFTSFEELWEPFEGGQGPAPGYVTGLDPEAREKLRARLEEGLPRQGDGSIPLRARAWAVRGTA